MFLIIPYWILITSVPVLMVVPVYFFNQWLIQKIRPRESGKKLLAYFMITILASFIYISAGVFLVIRLAKYL